MKVVYFFNNLPTQLESPNWGLHIKVVIKILHVDYFDCDSDHYLIRIQKLQKHECYSCNVDPSYINCMFNCL